MGLGDISFSHGGRSSARTGKSLNSVFGPWGILFFVWYLVSYIALSIFFTLSGFAALMWLCFFADLVLAAIPAIILTVLSWAVWPFLSGLFRSHGLQIADEIGKFEHNPDGGWTYTKYVLGQKTGLDLQSSSPHILIVGGSQSGKSTAIRSLLERLLAKKQSLNPIILILAVLLGLAILAVVLYLYIQIVLPLIMLAIDLLQSGQLTQMGVYAGLAISAIGGLLIIAIFIWLVFYLKNRLKGDEESRGHVVIDFHSEYSYLADKGFLTVNALDYAPLAPIYPGEPWSNRVSDIVDSFLTAFTDVGDVQLAILKKALEQGMERNAGLGDALITIKQAMSAAKSYYEKDRYAGLHLRLEKIAGYASGQKNIHELVGENRNVVFDFSSIRDKNAADFYADLILRRYLAVLMERRLPTTIIIDEAHRLNNPKLRERGFTTTTIKIAREAGKFGGRLIIASQNLTDFPDGFSANFGNTLAFRMPSAADLHQLEKITGISGGLLQNVMNGLLKGEALLIAPKNHYLVVRVNASRPSKAPKKPEFQTFSSLPASNLTSTPSPVKTPINAPKIPRSEEIFVALKNEGAMTATDLSRKLNYPTPVVFRHLKALTEKGQVIRYENTETPEGMEVFYEVNDPHRQESSFHKILITKAETDLTSYGNVKVLGGWNNPDLIFNEKTAVEVETGTKPELQGFVEQVKKRFGQGYSSVIVIVINQRQKKRYEKVLSDMTDVNVLKFTELSRIIE